MKWPSSSAPLSRKTWRTSFCVIGAVSSFRFQVSNFFANFARAEVDQVHHRRPAAAGLRRRGAGVVARAARGLRRGHGLDSAAGRRGVLVHGFFPAAKTDVDLRFRPRTDARALDLA